MLHGVAAPGGEVAFGVGPGDEVGDIVLADGGEVLEGFGRGDEVVFGGAVFFVGDIEDGGGQVLEKLEDAGVGPLVFAEGFVVHEEVAEVAVAVDLVDPSGELLGGEGVLLPPSVAEAEGNVVGELVVLEEQPEGSVVGALDEVAVFVVGWAVDVGG